MKIQGKFDSIKDGTIQEHKTNGVDRIKKHANEHMEAIGKKLAFIDSKLKTRKPGRNRNALLRLRCEIEQKPLPLLVQQERHAANVASKKLRYLFPPEYNERIGIRGNPSDRGTSQPVFIYPRFRSGKPFIVVGRTYVTMRSV